MGYSVVTHDVTERRRHAEVRARLLEQVTTAQEEEQRRLARELHDETGQSLTSLLVGLRTLEEAPSLAAAREQVAELRRVTARTLDEVRRLARGLRPGVLDELGLVPGRRAAGARLRADARHRRRGERGGLRRRSGCRPPSRPPSIASSRRR